MRTEAEIREEIDVRNQIADDGDGWSAAWAEALEWVLS